MIKVPSVLCCFLLLAFSLAAHVYGAKKQVKIYELKRGDFSVKLTNWGATVISLLVPDKNGVVDDIVLGYDSIQQYTNDSTYFGAIVGRVANRIGGAQFSLRGKHYKLVANEGVNILHGGHRGFSDVIWNVERYQKDSLITFSYDSFDGEQGFPGNVSVMVTYMFIETNKLVVKMEAKALNKASPINLALHTYWNLRGHNSGTILSHQIQLFGSKYTRVDDQLIPTGEIVSVKDTPYDFLQSNEIGSRIDKVEGGYDINYVLDVNTSSLHLTKAATVYESQSGRRMELWTNQIGVQFYTSNKLDNVKGKGGSTYNQYAAFCLETQGFPDSVNYPYFPSQIVNPGETYKHVMVFRFTAK